MKRLKFSPNQKQEPASAAPRSAGANLNQSEIDFTPSADDVARRAYLRYGNQVSLPDHELQRWLEAEAELRTERNLTGVHGFDNRT